ncbi:MAG: spermidine synthase, partial [Gemmatimonadetes bacterium]|nr:spermidine synthase [Gemmatimonadota bacterium]
MPRPTDLRAVLLLFFLSGATGLLYQVVWVRHFVHVFGATVLAVSTVLAAFMGGLALGGLAGGRLVARTRNPLRLYGLLEIGLAAYAGFVPVLLHWIHPLYGSFYSGMEGSFWGLSALRFVVSVILLLPPTFLMGATLPLLTGHAERASVGQDPGWVKRRVAWLYAINTFGAVAGTFSASFFLLPGLGLTRTLWLGVAINVGVGLVALVVSRGAAGSVPGDAAAEEPGDDPAVTADTLPASPLPAAAVLTTAGVLGFSALALEVLWTRTLSL